MMRQTGQAAAIFALLAGVFWAGRVSTHGLTAFWEHWWCPLPLVLILAGAAGIAAARLLARRARPGT
ncbi:MAG TPA: hypothetical protein VF843_11520 [Streptosporangiaceae bacterium]